MTFYLLPLMTNLLNTVVNFKGKNLLLEEKDSVSIGQGDSNQTWKGCFHSDGTHSPYTCSDAVFVSL